jgi:ABC-type Fe3+ transport system permease subunit
LYASLVLGRIALGDGERATHWSSVELAAEDFWAWVLGSFMLATLAALAGGLVTLVIAAGYRRRKGQRAS